jgi:hypothetical protein
MRILAAIVFALLATTAARAEVRSFVQRQAFIEAIDRRVQAHDFAGIDDLAEALRVGRARFADGRWKLDALYTALRADLQPMAGDDADWERLRKDLIDLARHRNSSRSAWLIYATALEARAWQIRGDGFANTVSPEAWVGFRKYERDERNLLDSHRKRLSANPAWYVLRIDVAINVGEGEPAIDALLREAVAREPFYYASQFAVVRHFWPQWGGSIEAMADFMDRTVHEAMPPEGASMYARLTWDYSGDGFQEELMNSPRFNWEMMKHSIDDVLAAYPDDWNAQEFLLLACERSDKPEASRLLRYIKEAPSPALLGKNLSLYETCLEWARGSVPAFFMHDPRTGTRKLIQ